jgi:hypothetical protein
MEGADQLPTAFNGKSAPESHSLTPHLQPLCQINSKKLRHIISQTTGSIGHNLPQEAPTDFAQAVVDVDGY